jgi:hypothetical protein
MLRTEDARYGLLAALVALASCNTILGLDEVKRIEAGAAVGATTSGAGGALPNGTCAAPFPIDGEASGTLFGAANDVMGFCGDGPEVVYAYTATGEGMLAELVPSVGHDLALSIRRDCEEPAITAPCCAPEGEPGCDDAGATNCVCQVDASCCRDEWTANCVNLVGVCGISPGCPTRACSNYHPVGVREQAFLRTTPGETHYVHVAGSTATDSGDFTLRVNEATFCDDDSNCSGFKSPHSCVIEPTTQSYCQPDESCTDTTIASVGTQSGSTYGRPPVHSGSCLPFVAPAHGSGPEQVFAFTSNPKHENGSQLTITVASVADLMVYVREDPCSQGAELACADAAVGEADELSLQAAAGTLLYIFVDSKSDDDQGDFTLSIEEVAL